MIFLNRENFEWITEVNKILSKRELGFQPRGQGRFETDYDIILAHFNSNLSLLNAIPETKQILFAYLRVLDRFAILAKKLLKELQTIKSRLQYIKVGGRVVFFYPEDKSIFTLDDIEGLETAYSNIMEAFRNLARKYIFTLLSGIDTGERDEEQQVEGKIQPPPIPPAPQYPSYYLHPQQPHLPQQQYPPQQGNNQQGGVESGK